MLISITWRAAKTQIALRNPEVLIQQVWVEAKNLHFYQFPGEADS